MTIKDQNNPLFDKFLKHLFDCRDTDNLIIKGHILTEYAMNYYIELSSIEKINLNESRFTYSNKIDIVKMFGLFKKHTTLNNELKLLNKLRNSIAHKLKYDEQILIEFLRGFENYRKAFKLDKLDHLDINDEIFYELDDEKITVKGSHLLLMFYISIICVTIFSSSESITQIAGHNSSSKKIN